MAVELCECGCGEPAPLATRTNARRGTVKGQPLRFVLGHNNRGRKVTRTPEHNAKISKTLQGHSVSTETRVKLGNAARGRTLSAEWRANIGAAGIGRVPSDATRAKISASQKGTRIANNSPSWKGDEASVGALHTYLNKTFPKKGICEECNRARRTDYALITGRIYSRNRDDYRELCRRCHARYDNDARRASA